MLTENFKFQINDFTGTAALLKKMRQRMEDTVKLYRATQSIPSRCAPGWRGDVMEHLEGKMKEYAVEARALQNAAEKLSHEALVFIEKVQRGHDEFLRKFKGIKS